MRALALAALAATLLLGCGTAPVNAKSSVSSVDRLTPKWEDAFERTPQILLVARPQAIRRDAVYGSLLKTLSALAAAKGGRATTRVIEVFESADEVLVGLRDGGDITVVVRGVRPDLAPEKLANEQGKLLWKPAHEHARTPEFVQHDLEERPQASLFVLPERTWVLATGDSRDRTREAFASPLGRSAPARDDRALVSLRVDGAALLHRIPALSAPGGRLEHIGRGLQAVTFVLGPAREGLVASLTYAEEGSAAASEDTLRQVIEVFGRLKRPNLAWIADAKVVREGRSVRGHVELPPALLHDLPTVVPGDLDL